jgi:hypothetical protein
LPLIILDEAVGVLALYTNKAEFFKEEEMKLLTELAGDISFGGYAEDRDRSFVIKMNAPEGLALVSTIIILAHAFKLKVVAEGVETEEQSRQLRSLDCDEMQGYLFSNPVPIDIFVTKFLAPLPPSDE